MASYTGTGRDTSRIQHLEEERKRKREELERQKSAISEATATSKYRLGENFVSHKESVEDLLRKYTVGLGCFQDLRRVDSISSVGQQRSWNSVKLQGARRSLWQGEIDCEKPTRRNCPSRIKRIPKT
uniref:Uncharacterized protein n=1 Tax=Rhodosorus marinus TaxID=101924 RepID=A0A6T6LQY6_9RHOD|mmetsp:Transcript_19117/g.27711  ORF Transcript_19117/g.27711 Transcript_19117/m.27711 type:complete len:127 (+) Transcript_19117:248-628(+)